MAESGSVLVREKEAGDIYLRAFALALLGYAVLGKGFAYVGAPPLFVGEFLFVAGILMLFRSGCLRSTFTIVPNLILALLGAWVIARTVPFIGLYRVDALRDSVVVLYGGFALIVCALLIEKPRRLNDAFHFFSNLSWLYGPFAWLLYYISKAAVGIIPPWPGSMIPLLFVRPGEVAVHVAGSVVFALLLFPRMNLLWSAMVLVSVGVCSAQSRGGMLAIMLPVFLASVISGRIRVLTQITAVVALVLSISYVFRVEVEISSEYRALSAEQLINNIGSIFEGSSTKDLDGTKLWRIRWWETIQGYTFGGPYFWTGKGFGVGLAEADGFVVGGEGGESLLRSPHNVNMTILARAGVPGLALWVALLGSWFTMMLWTVVVARARGAKIWSHFILFLTCYLLSVLINASFDVALEGPMLGIWFWMLFGMGCGSVMIFRAQCAMEASTPPNRTGAATRAGAPSTPPTGAARM